MASAMSATAFSGAKLQTKSRMRTRSRVAVVARADNKAALGLAAVTLAAVLVNAPLAKADLTEDLLARSTANKEVNDKKRLATSYSNFARSRTVSDNTCKFPNNVFGCDAGGFAADVKYISDDIKLECEGKEAGKCASKVSIPEVNK